MITRAYVLYTGGLAPHLLGGMFLEDRVCLPQVRSLLALAESEGHLVRYI